MLGEMLGFFFEVNGQLKDVNEDLPTAVEKLIARNDRFYNKTMFRAFLQLTKEECDTMSVQDYIDYLIMFKQVINIWENITLPKI